MQIFQMKYWTTVTDTRKIYKTVTIEAKRRENYRFVLSAQNKTSNVANNKKSGNFLQCDNKIFLKNRKEIISHP